MTARIVLIAAWSALAATAGLAVWIVLTVKSILRENGVIA